ncbi:MAG: AI-2E family transporter [Pseudomonadota bacterium]
MPPTPASADAPQHHQERPTTPAPVALLDAAASPPPSGALAAAGRPPLGALTVLASLMVVAVLYVGRDVIVPLALATLLGFLLDPLVTRLRRWGAPRALAVSLVMALTLGVLGAGALFVGGQVVQLSKDLPTYQNTVRSKLRDLRQVVSQRGPLDGVARMASVVGDELDATRRALDKPIPGSARAANNAPAPRVQLEPAPRSALQSAGDMAESVLAPVGTAGIVLVFMFFILLDRNDLRDRLLRLAGGHLQLTTDALAETGRRLSRYLGMQLLVNLSYGIPMAAGLALIGVPGAVLWGLLAAALRFVPYIGPLVAAVFPLSLAFAVDPGWQMLLWTLALVLLLELISNNIVEPWLYGASTGLSAMSIIVSAVFWTAVWGPVGLILATPLTVCLAVLGRHVPALAWLDVLLGNQPVFDPPTRLYQRLLAGDVEEAMELGAEAGDAASFYSNVAVPALCLAANDHVRVASAEHRHRVSTGMAALVDDLRSEQPPPDSPPGQAVQMGQVLCIGARWELDTLAADMLAHALALQGMPAQALPAGTVAPAQIGNLPLQGVQVVCLSYFSPTPEAHVRYVARRLRRRQPGLRLVAALWNPSATLLSPGTAQQLGVDAVAVTLEEALQCVQALGDSAQPVAQPTIDEARETLRLQALHDSGALEPGMRGLFDRAALRAADIFDVPLAMVSLVNADCQLWQGVAGLDEAQAEAARSTPRAHALCGWVVALEQSLVVHDTARDPRFADNPVLTQAGVRFYAGAPLRSGDGLVIGALCIMDRAPRVLEARELRLLGAMADDLMASVAAARAETGTAPARQIEDGADSTGIPLGPAGGVVPA